MRTLLILFPIVLVMSACTLPQGGGHKIATKNHVLLQEQQAALDEYALRLDSLSGSQDELLLNLEQIQSQIRSVSKQVLRVSSQTGELPQRDNRVTVVENVVDNAKSEPRKVGGKAVLGRVEYVWLGEAGEYFKARIDTGAKASFMSAKKIQPFERNSERWVRFDIKLENKTIPLEAPIARYVRVRQTSEDQLERRPVIKLAVRLGEIAEQTEFTLSDRDAMLYPLILGRSFLQDIAIVDVAKKFTRRRDPKLTAQVDR